MKYKDKEALRILAVPELKAELRQALEKRFNLEFKHSSTPLSNPLELRSLRRKIAMLQTFVREKERTAKPAGKAN